MFTDSQLEVLNYFKSSEGELQTHYLDDKYVLRVCSSWGFITKHIITVNTKPPEDENQLWAWLWQGVKISIGELAYVTGSRDKVLAALAVARANRLIYPDGTLNKFVLQILKPSVEDVYEPVIIEKKKTNKKSKPYIPKPNKNPSGKATIKKGGPIVRPMKI